MSTEPKRPKLSLSVGSLQVALWENEVENRDGSIRTMKSVSLKRSYFSKDENKFIEQKIAFNPAEIGCVIGLLDEMKGAVVDRRGEDAQATADEVPFDV